MSAAASEKPKRRAAPARDAKRLPVVAACARLRHRTSESRLANAIFEVAIVRARPAGATLVRTTTIADFRNRPAAEWGAELSRFLAGGGRDPTGRHGTAAAR